MAAIGKVEVTVVPKLDALKELADAFEKCAKELHGYVEKQEAKADQDDKS